MNKLIAVLWLSLIFSMGPALQGTSSAQTAPSKESKTTKSSSAKTTEATKAPSDSEIADAKVKGMVWVNTSSKVYHKEGSKVQGKTKSGKFMPEDDAKKAGYHEAKNKTATATKSKSGASKKQISKIKCLTGEPRGGSWMSGRTVTMHDQAQLFS